jgi:inner membrane protein involved in colicin E2 resistance
MKTCCSSKELFELDDNVQIILIEDFPCESKNELERRERFHIEGNTCVNKRLPAQTEVEKKEYTKAYYKAYYEANVEHGKANSKAYFEANRAEILKRLKEKITCDNCGSVINRVCKSHHQKTFKCINFKRA